VTPKNGSKKRAEWQPTARPPLARFICRFTVNFLAAPIATTTGRSIYGKNTSTSEHISNRHENVEHRPRRRIELRSPSSRHLYW
jgi:hypothetical protein